MGNCLFGGALGPVDVTAIGDDGCDGNGNGAAVIKVVTTNGGIMEFTSPITVEFITDEFPGHGIFPSRNSDQENLLMMVSCWYYYYKQPLPRNQLLEAGESYYLLPLGYGDKNGRNIATCPKAIGGHSRSNSTASPVSESQVVDHRHHHAPYRMSFDSRGIWKRSQTQEFSPRARSASKNKCGSSNGFWKVKLVISPEQLLEILSQEARTQELIESVRTVAKSRRNNTAGGGGGSSGGVSPIMFSGTLSGTGSNESSRRHLSYSSNKDDTLIDFF
ncbi:OLC1v1024472C2 [Oldenlandia corymbosa var. corymbosa]|nr:OLC1v1024472C2 [Oldenlandia corymbosa var. corymbosa]